MDTFDRMDTYEQDDTHHRHGKHEIRHDDSKFMANISNKVNSRRESFVSALTVRKRSICMRVILTGSMCTSDDIAPNVTSLTLPNEATQNVSLPSVAIV